MQQFGWIPFDERTKEVNEKNDELLLGMSEFNLVGSGWKEKEKVCLWDCVKTVTGKHLPAFSQQIGSCVGHGLTKALWYLMYAEIVRLGDKEKSILPYEPYLYAQSRVCAGISGNSDGSTGAGAATAAKKYGVLSSQIAGLPEFEQTSNEIIFPGSIDKAWGRKGAPSKYISEAQKHLVKTVAPVRTTNQAIEALQNYFPITIASNWGGYERCPVVDGVLLNSRVTNWAHQMCVVGVWFHKTLGTIFNVNNSWGPKIHGKPPDDSPFGSFWIKERDLQDILDERDSYAFSSFDGFPADGDTVDRNLFKLI